MLLHIFLIQASCTIMLADTFSEILLRFPCIFIIGGSVILCAVGQVRCSNPTAHWGSSLPPGMCMRFARLKPRDPLSRSERALLPDRLRQIHAAKETCPVLLGLLLIVSPYELRLDQNNVIQYLLN